MNNDDERDYEEEEYNMAEMEREAEEEWRNMKDFEWDVKDCPARANSDAETE